MDRGVAASLSRIDAPTATRCVCRKVATARVAKARTVRCPSRESDPLHVVAELCADDRLGTDLDCRFRLEVDITLVVHDADRFRLDMRSPRRSGTGNSACQVAFMRRLARPSNMRSTIEEYRGWRIEVRLSVNRGRWETGAMISQGNTGAFLPGRTERAERDSMQDTLAMARRWIDNRLVARRN